MKILLLFVLLAGGEVRMGYYPATLPPVDPTGKQLARTLDEALAHGTATAAAWEDCQETARLTLRLPNVVAARCEWVLPQPSAAD
jgi:hypothetical protein